MIKGKIYLGVARSEWGDMEESRRKKWSRGPGVPGDSPGSHQLLL